MCQELDEPHNTSFGAQKKGKDSGNSSDKVTQDFHLNFGEGEELSFRYRQDRPVDEENIFRPREKPPKKAEEGTAKVRTTVQEQPLAALGAGIALGFVVGWLLSGRKKD